MTETRFTVCDAVETGGLLPVVDHRSILQTALRRPIEAMWTPDRPLIACEEDHALLSAMRTAFYEHLPLRLSPDAIWLTLARGFALHVNLHAESLRHRFVQHEGKKKLVVERLDFLPGADNPWEEAFADFNTLIDTHTGGLSSLLEADFSTSGTLERAISQLMTMETFQPYFEYEMMAGCGIPSIILTGTEEDWRRLREKASKFGDYGLETWIAALDPVLAMFERAKRHDIDTDFWRSMFRYRSGSGPAVMTGWANVLFPYVKDFQDPNERLIANPFLSDWRQRLEIGEHQDGNAWFTAPQGTSIGAFPACATSVPLRVIWGIRPTEMLLVGGLLGVSQSPNDHALSAECGWIVAYAEPMNSSQDSDGTHHPVDVLRPGVSSHSA
jgi:hypothetical protein